MNIQLSESTLDKQTIGQTNQHKQACIQRNERTGMNGSWLPQDHPLLAGHYPVASRADFQLLPGKCIITLRQNGGRDGNANVL